MIFGLDLPQIYGIFVIAVGLAWPGALVYLVSGAVEADPNLRRKKPTLWAVAIGSGLAITALGVLLVLGILR